MWPSRSGNQIGLWGSSCKGQGWHELCLSRSEACCGLEIWAQLHPGGSETTIKLESVYVYNDKHLAWLGQTHRLWSPCLPTLQGHEHGVVRQGNEELAWVHLCAVLLTNQRQRHCRQGQQQSLAHLQHRYKLLWINVHKRKTVYFLLTVILLYMYRIYSYATARMRC